MTEPHAPRLILDTVWGAIAWGVQLDPLIGTVVGEMDDDIVGLLALEVSSVGLLPPGALVTNRWQTMVAQAEVLRCEHWLLAYESHLQGWFNVPAVASHSVFKPMFDAKISFLDKRKNVPLFPTAAGPIPGGPLEDFYA